MSLQATATVEVSADISLRVPRGGSETLESGVAEVLDAVTGVTEASVDRVRGVRPAATDIHVDAAVRLRVALPESADPAARLADGFGIVEVHAVSVEPV